MRGDRRGFLRMAAAGMAAAGVGGAGRAAEPGPQPFGMPRDMELINLRRASGYGLAVRLREGVLDVAAASRAHGLPAPADMDDLLQNGRGPMLRALIDAVEAAPDPRLMLDAATLAYAPVVTRPEKIIMLGFNYRQHAEETGTPIPKYPVLYNKFNNALNHHGGTIPLPVKVAREFDYETELVMVIGRTCRDVPEAEALDYVAGYCTGQDFSARDLQGLTSQLMIGKTPDGFAPLGPHLVTADRVPDPQKLRITTRLNGEIRQDSSTGDMIFPCRQLVSFASSIMTLKPGDIVFTGSPPGSIAGEKGPRAQRRWLRAGDELVSGLEGLGDLRFRLA